MRGEHPIRQSDIRYILADGMNAGIKRAGAPG
jgi:hypothetical protein